MFEMCSHFTQHVFATRDLTTEWDPLSVTTEHITAAIGKMKCGKAAGPSRVMAEMPKAAGPESTELIR